MKPQKNVKLYDRMIRSILAEIIVIIALFWLSGWIQIVFLIFAGIFFLMAVIGFCPIYSLWHGNYSDKIILSKWKIIIFAILFLTLAIGGSFLSIFFSKKIFLEDFSAMNQYYKQSLFTSSQGDRDGLIKNYTNLLHSYNDFSTQYNVYRPYTLRSDTQFSNDIKKGNEVLLSIQSKVKNGDMMEVHLGLEPFRPIFQEMFKRNNISLLAVYLVDFHDPMEKVIAAASAQNTKEVLATYSNAHEKLLVIEAEANDTEVVAIRTALEKLKKSAEHENKEALPAESSELKSAFSKVYLSRG